MVLPDSFFSHNKKGGKKERGNKQKKPNQLSKRIAYLSMIYLKRKTNRNDEEYFDENLGSLVRF
jgi:hypothetical protein